MPSPLKIAGIGDGTHADSRFADEYAFDPTSTRSRPSPAAMRAARTRSPSAHGPNSSKPGWPAMPWRSDRTSSPSIVNVVMPKNFVGGTSAPVAFSMRASAFGPWIS